jgi:excisionase family DNA binding protein
MADYPESLTLDEVAALLRLKPVTIRSWRLQRKNLKFRKIGGRVLVHRDDLIRFVEESGKDGGAA